MIVAGAEAELLVVGADTRADAVGRSKVERGPRDEGTIAGGNQAGVDRSEAGGAKRDFVVEHVAMAGAGEIEIRVVGEIDGRALIRRGPVIDAKTLIGGERIGDFGGKLAGVTLFTVCARVAETKCRLTGDGGQLGRPEDFVETDVAAMKMAGNSVGGVVRGEAVGLRPEAEFAAGDAVSDPANDSAKMGGLGRVTLDRIKA